MLDSSIGIGDSVYIGGLYGEDFTAINNKIGKVNKIFFSSTPEYATYIAQVDIDGELFAVNLAYMFKLSNLFEINNEIHFSGSISNPLNYYYRKINMVGTPTLAIDELGIAILLCNTRENLIQPLTLTSLN